MPLSPLRYLRSITSARGTSPKRRSQINCSETPPRLWKMMMTGQLSVAFHCPRHAVGRSARSRERACAEGQKERRLPIIPMSRSPGPDVIPDQIQAVSELPEAFRRSIPPLRRLPRRVNSESANVSLFGLINDRDSRSTTLGLGSFSLVGVCKSLPIPEWSHLQLRARIRLTG